MPRPRRLDFKGAIHLVRIAGRDGLKIYFDLDDLGRLSEPARATDQVRVLENFIAAACEECGAALYAYRIESNACTLLVEAGGSPLDALMARICGQYSRYLHREGLIARGLHPYARRYESRVIEPTYLAHAVRRVHGSAQSTPAYTSVSAYTGGRAVVPLETQVVKDFLVQRGYIGVKGYRAFMAEGESKFVTRLFEDGALGDSRVVGSRAFVIRAHLAVAHPPAVPSREQLISLAASIIERGTEVLFASSHAGALGRALVAWYAVRSGASTLTEAGRWFSVSAATLGHGIRHYRRRRPELFERELPIEREC